MLTLEKKKQLVKVYSLKYNAGSEKMKKNRYRIDILHLSVL